MNTEFIFPLVLGLVLFAVELLYFRIARHFKIIDKPNQRSSHDKVVMRGGGVIFIIAVLTWFFFNGMLWIWFVVGLTAAAAISFADDVRSQPAGLRFAIHLFAVLLMFYATGLFSWPIALWLLALVVCIGALNAFNFMDGINGITGLYALCCLTTFGYINNSLFTFTENTFIVANIVGVLVFLYFNYRKKAACFAGDVGSVTIAFVLIFLLLQLIVACNNLAWVILFLVYGVDSVVTIIYRLRKKENIFKPHRTHLYQYLSNEYKWPHRVVSAIYATIQLCINVLLILFIQHDQILLAVATGIFYLLIYLVIRETILRKLTAEVGNH